MLNSNNFEGQTKALSKGQIMEILDISDDVVFSEDSFIVTDVDIPVRLEDGTIVGKARVFEGEGDEATVLIELETTNPLVTSLFKTQMYEVSLIQKSPQDMSIESV